MQGGPIPSPPRIRSFFCSICPLLVEHCFDRRRIFRQLLDTQVFRLVVRKAQVVLRGEQRILDFLQVRDGLVDLVNGGIEPLTRYPVVAGKALFEGIHILLKVENVELLVLDDLKLLLVLERVEGRIA